MVTDGHTGRKRENLRNIRVISEQICLFYILECLWEQDFKGSVAARGVRKQLSVVFPERDRARRRESNPVIPTKNKDLSHRDQVLFLFLFRFRSLTFATQTKSCFAFGECFIPTIFGALCTKNSHFRKILAAFLFTLYIWLLCSKSNFLH